jgi:hypothetical protein
MMARTELMEAMVQLDRPVRRVIQVLMVMILIYC